MFDGPNKPPYKRNKRSGADVASIPEFLAKQLLKQFALPFHIAPGEAEAECALLQREGVVDAVLSEDVDTLMFGSGLTLRNWSPDTPKGKVVTHVNMYDAATTKATSGLDRHGFVLAAMMSGGDYNPDGVADCGIRTAVRAAKAGFGEQLCNLQRNNIEGLARWKERLCHELKTNESKFFEKKREKLVIPQDFPQKKILRYYTHPCVSSLETIEKLRKEFKWDQNIDYNGLRTFTGEAFDWQNLGGAKKFIRNLAPAMLARQLRLNATTHVTGEEQAPLIQKVSGKRNHHTTDFSTEIRVDFRPLDLVPIDLSAEPLDPVETDMGEEDGENVDLVDEEEDEPKKKRSSSTYDPTLSEKVWVMEALMKVGASSILDVWLAAEAAKHDKAARRGEAKAAKSKKHDMPAGAIRPHLRVMKPGQIGQRLTKDVTAASTETDISGEQSATVRPSQAQPASTPPASPSKHRQQIPIDLTSPPSKESDRQRLHDPSQRVKKAQRQPRTREAETAAHDNETASNIEAVIECVDLSDLVSNINTRKRRKSPDSQPSTPQRNSKKPVVIEISSGPTTPMTQKSIRSYLSPSRLPPPSFALPVPDRSKQTSMGLSNAPIETERVPLASISEDTINTQPLQTSSEKELLGQHGRFLRIRDSLAGTWSQDAQPNIGPSDGGRDKASRQWRLSEIEAIDLTTT